MSQRVQYPLAAILIGTSFVTLGCRAAGDASTDTRTATLEQAFRIAANEPERACQLFDLAGPGSVLEHARMEVWHRSLEASAADAEAWRRYLAHRPPPELEAAARLDLMEVLIEAGDDAGAVAERQLLGKAWQVRADELLLDATDDEVRVAAGTRLATSSPRRLVRRDPELERRIVRSLSPDQHLERSRGWRRDGQPSRAVSELQRFRWQGGAESQRRREVALAELARGRPRSALRVLPSGRAATAEDDLLRARAHRDLAWQRFPSREASGSFERCLDSTSSALTASAKTAQRTALELRLECATEASRLDIAVTAWRQLEAAGGVTDRRNWFGRRLGVALAWARDPAADAMARALPDHERCIRFWIAVADGDRRPTLQALTEAPVGDLYGQWARELLSSPQSSLIRTRPPLQPAAVPSSVQVLVSAGTRGESVRQWRRIARARPLSPAEALAAAQLMTAAGFNNDAIRSLLSGFPELGTVHLDGLPVNAVTAYLPLGWQEVLLDTAAETGLQPWLIAAVARQESVFSAHARSPRGAVGVMQLLPSTAAGHARAVGLPLPADLGDPTVNLRLGARELARLAARFGALEPAVAAYNAGETRVRRWWSREPDRRRFVETIPIPETYTYVRRVMYLSDAYRLVYDELWRTRR